MTAKHQHYWDVILTGNNNIGLMLNQVECQLMDRTSGLGDVDRPTAKDEGCKRSFNGHSYAGFNAYD